VRQRALTRHTVTPPVAPVGSPFRRTALTSRVPYPTRFRSDYTALVTLGDGNTVTLSSTASANGQIVAHGDGTFDVNLSYSYAEELTGQTFSLDATDHNSQASRITSSFNVAEAALTTNTFTP